MTWGSSLSCALRLHPPSDYIICFWLFFSDKFQHLTAIDISELVISREKAKSGLLADEDLLSCRRLAP